MKDGTKIGLTIVAAIACSVLAVNPWSNPWLCLAGAIGSTICAGICGLWVRSNGKDA